MSRSELRSLVEGTPAPELPQLIGDLEAARAAASCSTPWRSSDGIEGTPSDDP